MRLDNSTSWTVTKSPMIPPRTTPWNPPQAASSTSWTFPATSTPLPRPAEPVVAPTRSSRDVLHHPRSSTTPSPPSPTLLASSARPTLNPPWTTSRAGLNARGCPTSTPTHRTRTPTARPALLARPCRRGRPARPVRRVLVAHHLRLCRR